MAPTRPKAGSCGTAAYLRQQVIVADIATDPKWTAFRELALSHGLQACWSVPIHGSNRRVLGTFAAYYQTPRMPAPDELHEPSSFQVCFLPEDIC